MQKVQNDPAKANSMDEAEIRREIDDHIVALRVMNLEEVMLIYAADIVCFDLTPPLKYVGVDAKKKTWELAFSRIVPPLDYEIRDLDVTVSGETAFCHSLNRMNANLGDGRRAEFWLRWTACFQRIDGKWRIVLEHVSVPADFETGKAVFDLKPC